MEMLRLSLVTSTRQRTKFRPAEKFPAPDTSFTWKRLKRFSYDLEITTRQQYRNNQRTEIERFDWFIERIQTRVAFGWLSERSGEKTSCPKNFLEINRYFALTSYCNVMGQSNNAFSI